MAHGRYGVDPERVRVILALETSCDDTCAAVVTSAGEIRSNVISSQGVHDRFGGVVPEIASRHHLELIGDVVDDALGRAGVALPDVGSGGGHLRSRAGGGAARRRRDGEGPRRRVRAPAGAASIICTATSPPHSSARIRSSRPFLSLVASGGHTLLARVTDLGPDFEVLGQTLDDAAGEAFDKGARMLGLGYPGGPALERLAAAGDPQRVSAFRPARD